jgi:cation diffusion facilitator family transporter
MQDRTNDIIKASWIGIIGNSILAIIKLIVGFISGSFAVIGDGIDSANDVATFFVSLFAAKIMIKPPNKTYPYGYKRAEAIATNIIAFVIFFVGAQLLISSVKEIFADTPHEIPSMLAIYITIISIFGKALLAAIQFRIGKRAKSNLLIANAKNMKNDILLSASVLTGLFFTFYLKIPVIDLILAILVSLWIIKVALEILIKTNRELMDGMKNQDLYAAIIEAAEEIEGVHNPHRLRIRQHSNMYVLGFDIEVNPDITVQQAHELCDEVQKNIKDKVQNIYDIMIHIEPRGNKESERFGISRSSLNN